MKKKLLILLFALAAIPAFAAEDMDSMIARLMKDRQIPGLALLVVQDGKTVVSKGYGFSNLELQAPVKPETVFQSGSVGKQFTATAIMMLVEEGKIKLDDPLSKYMKIPKNWNAITIRNLLTHTSGLGDYPEKFDFRHDLTEDEEFAIMEKVPLQFKPGERFSYSNVGFLTLGVLIHKITGKFYGDFLQERIFQPLGMTTTRIISEADIIPNRADGYVKVKGELKNQEWVAPSINTTADGSLYFTILDLEKWDQALYTERLVKKSTLDQMWTPMKLNDGSTSAYGFGWELNQKNSHRLIEHGGSWQGFNTYIGRYVDDKLTIVVLTNLDGAGPSYIGHAVAGFFNPAVALPVHTPVNIENSVLALYDGQYRFDADDVVQLTAEGGSITIKSGERSSKCVPDSKDSCFVPDSEITVKFEKNAAGQITLVYDNEGERQIAEKVR